MSNKIVPVVYRSIVDDVMVNIRSEFQEFGIDDQVLHDLQSKWELKILQSNVAEFEKPSSSSNQQQQQQQASQSTPYATSLPPLPGPPPSSYQNNNSHLPPPPTLAGPPPPSGMYARAAPLPPPPTLPPLASYYSSGNELPPIKSDSPHQSQSQTPLNRIPQLDGPSIASSQEGDSDGSSSAGRDSASPPSKSVPLPSIRLASSSGGAAGQGAGGAGRHRDLDEAVIGSDLDDSEDEDGGELDDDDVEGGSKVLCTYDRVQRVKNKWKCVLKDGMVHINGKDYLFSKCTGEFEW